MQTSLYQEAQPGMALLAYPDTYIVIDLETTGFSPVHNEIIEISALKYRGQQLVDSFSHLVKPSQPISWQITQITGIDNSMVAAAPTIDQLLPAFLQFIGEQVLLGYNVGFDIGFLRQNLQQYTTKTLTNNFIDVLQLVKLHLQGLANYKQTTVAAYFGLDTQGAHRAAVDCEICAGCYWQLKQLYQQQLKAAPWQPSSFALQQQPLAQQSLVILGQLESTSFHCLENLIEQLGGLLQSKVTSETNMVIVGTGTKQVLKQRDFLQAESLKKQGYPLYLLKENIFLQALQQKKYLIKKL